MPSQAPGNAAVSPIDVRLRVIALALEPALVLSRIAGLPLDDVQTLVATGYFREMRSRGHSLRAVARRFGKSLRTVATLSKQTAEQGRFAQLGERMTLQRKLVAHIANGGSVTRAHLPRAMGIVTPELIDDVTRQLIEDGIVIEDGGKLRVVADLLLLTGSTLDQRLDSVRHFLDACTQMLHERFFVPGSDQQAFARVLSFAALPEELAQIGKAHYAALAEAVVQADARASQQADATPASVVFGYVRSPGAWWSRPRSASVDDEG